MTPIDLQLGQVGKAYFLNCLEPGVGMCSLLRSLVSRGEVIGGVPPATRVDRACQFDVGGLMPARAGLAWLLDKIRDDAAGRRASLVLQDVWADVDDESVRPLEHEGGFTDGASIYYAARAKEMGDDGLRRLLSMSTSFLWVLGLFDLTGCELRTPVRGVVDRDLFI